MAHVQSKKPVAAAVEELWVWKGGKWRDETTSAEQERAKGMVRYVDIAWFYGNQIDYLRVVMCIVAAFTITWQWPLTSALLIFVSVLLDWIDGPVARAYNQCTIFGSGVDWLADVLCQVITLGWWVQLDPKALPWLMIMTSIETACCVFDFATTTTLRYPKYPEEGRGGFFKILDWSMPSNSYTHMGTFLWLAYPIFSMACCLDLAWGANKGIFLTYLLKTTEYTMFIPTILYGWCELAYLVHIMDKWTEPRQDVNVK